MFLVVFLWDAHPIHISVSEVEITTEEINWSIRIYKDDLLQGMYGKVTDMAILDDQEKVRKDILSYISRNISVSVDGNSLKWTLEDIQPDPEAIWVIVSTPVVSSNMNTMTIRNSILLNIYKDQKNVVHLVSGSGKKDMVFEKGDDQKVISL